MTPIQALISLCEHCEREINAQPSKGDLPFKQCPFRHISDDRCEEFDIILEALNHDHR